MDQAKDLAFGADTVDEAVAGDEQLATRQAQLGDDAADLRGFNQYAGRLFHAVDQVGGRLRGLGFLDEVLNGVKEILPSRKGPNYRRPSHSRASRITWS